jgi:hypothetical protein
VTDISEAETDLTFSVATPGHVNYLRAKSVAERERWMHGLRRATMLPRTV